MINTTDPSLNMGFYRAHDLCNNLAGNSRLIGTVMDGLTKDGLTEYYKGRRYQMGYVSKVRPTPTIGLMALFRIYGLTPAMITRPPGFNGHLRIAMSHAFLEISEVGYDPLLLLDEWLYLYA